MPSDVIVVGGGVIGAAIAYHLSLARVGVTLVEAGEPPCGATAHSAAQIRIHHSNWSDVRLAAMSLPVFESWSDVVGGDCGFRQAGFAFLAADEARQAVDDVLKTLADAGVESFTMTPEAYGAEHPGLTLDGVGVVAVEPRSGYADPVLTTQTLLARAVENGARVVRNDRVVGLIRTGARVTGVRTAAGTYAAGHVVVAAGVHSRELCQTADVSLPLRTRRIGYAVADVDAAPAHMTIDDTVGVYFRPHGPGRVLFGVPLEQWDVAVPAHLSRYDVTPPEPGRVEAARTAVAARLPSIRAARLRYGATAVEAYSPDGHAVIGDVPGVDGLSVCTAFSGGGFKMAPAVGSAVARRLAGGVVSPELEPYRPDRFARGMALAADVHYRNM